MKKILFLMALLFLSASTVWAQQFSSGLSNKIILKTDLVYWLTGNAINAEIEYKLNKSFTLTAGYYTGSQQYPQSYLYSDYAAQTQVVFANPKITLADKGIINCTYYRVGVRKYLDRIIKAPFGPYVVLNAGYGSASLSGEYDAWLFDGNVSVSGTHSGPTVAYSYINVPYINVQFGSGVQYLLFKRVTLDAALCYDINDFETGDANTVKKTSGLTRNFGPSFINFGSAGGICVLVKAGVLLF